MGKTLNEKIENWENENGKAWENERDFFAWLQGCEYPGSEVVDPKIF